MSFRFSPRPDWPPLAWLATCRGPDVWVQCGDRVETGPEWFCEAAWAGDYPTGDFDRTDIVAGTGGRWRDDGVYFVSSGSTVDRLHSFRRDGETFVSNSLPCVLAAAGTSLRASYPSYSQDLQTIVSGIRRYRRLLPTRSGPVRLTYFDNLFWDGRDLEEVGKPGGHEDFRDFERYRDFLSSRMQSVLTNASSSDRRFPYLPVGTLSTGYDSATVASLARRFGCQEVISFDKARSGLADSGEAVAQVLGVTVLSVDTMSWRSEPFAEVPFLAGCDIGESVYASAEPHLRGRLLLTGYHGDKVWDLATSDLGPEIRRGDRSGLALTEYRLRAGFLHCPVPFWGVRQIREIHRISGSAEMRPWRLERSTYNRPICRRIVEGQGVPRNAFGVEKKAVGPIISEEFLSPTSLEDYLRWVGRHRWAWLRRGRLPPVRSVRFDRFVHGYAKLLRRATSAMRVRSRRLPVVGDFLGRGFERVEQGLRSPTPLEVRNLRRYVFAWAVERAQRAYTS